MKTGIFILADVLPLLGVLMLLVLYQPTLGNCQFNFGLVIEFFKILCPPLLAISHI
jgi:hypothetical protein